MLQRIEFNFELEREVIHSISNPQLSLFLSRSLRIPWSYAFIPQFQSGQKEKLLSDLKEAQSRNQEYENLRTRYQALHEVMDAGSTEECSVFIDNANIFIGAQYVPYERDPSIRVRDPSIRVNVRKLVGFLENGRKVTKRYVGGNGNSDSAFVREYQNMGYSVRLENRPRNGGVDVVDDIIHGQVMVTLIEHLQSLPSAYSQILVLATGDGNDNGCGVNTTFPQVIRLALEFNWKVEVVSWKRTTSKALQKLSCDYPGKVTLRYLDEERDDIVHASTEP
jgi:hypothetical protein